MARRSFLPPLLLLLLPLVAIVAADEDLYKPGTDVLILTEETFEEKVLKQDNLAFVQFYSPSCGPSIDFVDEYEKAARALKGLATVAVINGKTISQEMRDKYDVKGFPKVLIFGNDKKTPRKYAARRTADRMVQEVERMVEAARQMAMGEHASSGLGPPKMANAASPRSAAAKPEKVKKAGGCGCNKNKDKAADTTESTAGQCLLKNKDEAVTDAADGAAPCPHCGKSEPGSCPKCVGKAATGAEEDVATAPPAQEPFVVTEEMVWQEDEL